jgi:thiol-disulfide isomerase/thioredoxin
MRLYLALIALVVALAGCNGPEPINLERLNSRLIQNVTALERPECASRDEIVVYAFSDPLCTYCQSSIDTLHELASEFGGGIKVEEVCSPMNPDSEVICGTRPSFFKERTLFDDYGVKNLSVPYFVFNCKYARRGTLYPSLEVEKFEFATIACEVGGFKNPYCENIFSPGNEDLSKIDSSLLPSLSGESELEVLVEFNETPGSDRGLIITKELKDAGLTYKNIFIENMGLFNGTADSIKKTTGYPYTQKIYATSGIISRLAKVPDIEVQYYFTDQDTENFTFAVEAVSGTLAVRFETFNVGEWGTGDKKLFEKAFGKTPAMAVNGEFVDALQTPIIENVIAHSICARMNLSIGANLENCRKYSLGTNETVKLMMFTSNDCSICTPQVTTVLNLRDNMTSKLETLLIETSDLDSGELQLVSVYNVKYLPTFVFNGYREVIGTLTKEDLVKEVCKEIEC